MKDFLDFCFGMLVIFVILSIVLLATVNLG